MVIEVANTCHPPRGIPICAVSLCCGSEWNADVTLAREEAENHQLSEQLKDATINLRNEKRTALHMGGKNGTT